MTLFMQKRENSEPKTEFKVYCTHKPIELLDIISLDNGQTFKFLLDMKPIIGTKAIKKWLEDLEFLKDE